MKLKKKHFKRLQEIAKETNENGIFGMTGIRLNTLITDIELVQKPKTVQEKPLSWSSFGDRHVESAGNIFDQQKDPYPSYISDFLDEALVLSNKEPKIGDVGFFWTTGSDTRYGKIKEISSSEFKGETYTVYRIDQSDGCEFYVHFSKTPPELK